MQELALTWSHARAVWWLVVWRGVAGSVVIGGAIGLVWGAGAALLGFGDLVAMTSGPLGVVVGLLWSLLVVRMALRKRYSGFRLALIAT